MTKELQTVKQCLLKAGQIHKKHFRKITYSLKGPANLLTKADLEAQAAIIKIIKATFPEHDFLAEEEGVKNTGSRHSWIIDPIDGTTNYAHSNPNCCASVALYKDGKPFAGGVYDAFRDELFLAQQGKGATLNGKKMCVSKTAGLKNSLLVTGFPYDKAKYPAFYCAFMQDFLTKCHDVRRSGSAALDLAWIAAGRFDGYWEFNLNPWDVAAGRLLVQEAGGEISDFSGKAWNDASVMGRQTLATNAQIHAAMLKTIKKVLAQNGPKTPRQV